MTKDQLRTYLQAAAMALTGLANFWLWGPITFLKPILGNVALLLSAIASSDAILDQIVALFSQGAIKFTHPVRPLTSHDVAMLEKPTNQHLNAVIDAAPTSMNA